MPNREVSVSPSVNCVPEQTWFCPPVLSLKKWKLPFCSSGTWQEFSINISLSSLLNIQNMVEWLFCFLLVDVNFLCSHLFSHPIYFVNHFFIIFKCHCKVVYACLFRQWWGWLCCVDDVRYLTGSCSTGSKWPQSFTLFTVLFHVFYFFFYLVFCIIWLWRYFPIETVMFCMVLSVKPTPSLYQKYYFQCVSYAIFTMLQLLLCVSLLSTSISNDFHQHLRLFQHKYCWESNVALSPNKEDTGRLVRHVLFDGDVCVSCADIHRCSHPRCSSGRHQLSKEE